MKINSVLTIIRAGDPTDWVTPEMRETFKRSKYRDLVEIVHSAAAQSFFSETTTKNRNNHLIRVLDVRPDLLDAKDNEYNTPLHTAVRTNNLLAVKTLVQRGALANIRNKRKETALHLAVQLGNPEIVEEVLKARDADPVTRNARGYTALHIALLWDPKGRSREEKLNQLRIVEKLIKKNERDKASQQDLMKGVNFFRRWLTPEVKNLHDLPLKGAREETPLHLAALRFFDDAEDGEYAKNLCNILIKAGARLEQRNGREETVEEEFRDQEKRLKWDRLDVDKAVANFKNWLRERREEELSKIGFLPFSDRNMRTLISNYLV